MAQSSITGTIKSIGNVEERGSFRKREVIILERTGQRDQPVPIEFTQDRIDLLQSYKPGDEVTVTFFINGREWQPRDGGAMRYFLSLSASRIEHAGAQAPATAATAAIAHGNGAPPPSAADMPPQSAEEDDLPF